MHRTKVVNRAVDDKVRIQNALRSTGFQQTSDPPQSKQVHTDNSQDSASARYLTAINNLQNDKKRPENDQSLSMMSKKSAPVYVLPNKSTHSKTRDSPYQL